MKEQFRKRLVCPYGQGPLPPSYAKTGVPPSQVLLRRLRIIRSNAPLFPNSRHTRSFFYPVGQLSPLLLNYVPPFVKVLFFKSSYQKEVLYLSDGLPIVVIFLCLVPRMWLEPFISRSCSYSLMIATSEP